MGRKRAPGESDGPNGLPQGEGEIEGVPPPGAVGALPFPGAPAPGAPAPGAPAFPVPAAPFAPQLPGAVPNVPGVPGVPGIRPLGVPSLPPGLPGVPGVPGVPGIPPLPPGLAGVPGLPPGLSPGSFPPGLLPNLPNLPGLGAALPPNLASLVPGLKAASPALGRPPVPPGAGAPFNPNLDTESLAQMRFQQVAAEYEQIKTAGIDPQVSELAEHFGLDERVTRLLDEEMKKRRKTFEEDLQALWVGLEGAKNPAGMVMMRLKDMRNGIFRGMSAMGKKVQEYAKRYRLDTQAGIRLAEVLEQRPDPDGDLAKIAKHLERSNKPSSLVMMMLRDLRDGKPVKDPEYAAAIGSKLHEKELRDTKTEDRPKRDRRDGGREGRDGGREGRDGRDGRGEGRDNREGRDGRERSRSRRRDRHRSRSRHRSDRRDDRDRKDRVEKSEN